MNVEYRTSSVERRNGAIFDVGRSTFDVRSSVSQSLDGMAL